MRYLWQVLSHKWFVLVAGLTRVGGIPLWRLLIHDWSKFLPAEFISYRRWFSKPRRCERSEFDRAWLHHIHRNPHHWEHWMVGGTPIPMPPVFVREMVADWFGAGRGYQGSWEIQTWIDTNAHKPVLHPDSIAVLRSVLGEVGLRWPTH